MSTVVGNLRAILGLDSTSFQQGLNQATSRLQSAGKQMQSIGQSMSVAVSGPIVAFGGLSLRAAGNFEAAMNRVRAASGASADEMENLEALALKMGETTQFKASEAADAIEILAKNGLDASQILGGALEASMLLAAASGSDLAGAGDLATDVMLQFGKTAGEMTGLVDGMTGVLLTSKFGFDDYRLAIAQAGGVAGGLGVSFEDFNAAIAGTSSLFASGSDAGTSYKTFLQRLVPASNPAADAMRKLGLEFFNADGSMKSMAEVAQELQDGLEGLSDEARNDALSTIFGTDALRTAIGLAEQGAEGIERLKLTIGDASAEEQAAARMAGFNGEMLKLKSAIEALMIAIGNSGVLEWATKLTQQFTAFVLRIKDTNPELLKMGIIFGAVAAAVGPLLIGFGLLIQGLGPFVGIIRAVALAAGALGIPFAAAAIAIAAAAYAVYDNWDTVGPWFAEMGEALKATFQGLVDFVTGVITGDWAKAGKGIRDAWNGLDTFFGTLLGEVGSAFEALDERIKAPIERIKSALDWAERAGQATQGIMNRVTGAGAPSGGTTAPAGSDVIVPPTGDMQSGLAGGTAGIRVQGVTDAEAYGDGFKEGMGIQSPSKKMIEYGEYISQGLGIGVLNGEPQVSAASDTVGQSFASRFQPYFEQVINGTVSVKDAFASMLADMASQLMSSGLNSLLGSLGGALFGGDKLSGALSAAGLKIPGFATGTSYAPGGLAEINERGGEIVNLPRGTQVIPHDLSKQMLQQGGQVDVRVFMDDGGNWKAEVEKISGGVAARTTQQGISSYDKALPGRIQQFQANPRRR